MPISRRSLLAGVALSPGLLRGAQAPADFRSLAPAPPMGWNSWDSFATTIREDEARSLAKIMAVQLLPHGYNIFTIDAQWYEAGANGYDYRKDAVLTMDEFGRLTARRQSFSIRIEWCGLQSARRVRSQHWTEVWNPHHARRAAACCTGEYANLGITSSRRRHCRPSECLRMEHRHVRHRYVQARRPGILQLAVSTLRFMGQWTSSRQTT